MPWRNDHSSNKSSSGNIATMLIVFLVTSLCALGEYVVQARIKITFDDFKVAFLDEEYFDKSKTTGYLYEDEKTEEMEIHTTLSIIKELPEDTDIHFLSLMYSMGEYRIPTGIEVTWNLCESLDEQILVGPFLNALGITKETCPPGPGNYSQDGYRMPQDLLPEYMIENKYATHVDINVKGRQLWKVILYSFVQQD